MLLRVSKGQESQAGIVQSQDEWGRRQERSWKTLRDCEQIQGKLWSAICLLKTSGESLCLSPPWSQCCFQASAGELSAWRGPGGGDGSEMLAWSQRMDCMLFQKSEIKIFTPSD